MLKIYEVVDFSHGNTDFLSQLEDTDYVKNSMIAYYPQTVESEDKISKSVNFIKNRKEYPKARVNSYAKLNEIFKTTVGNFSKAMSLVEDKKEFVEKLSQLREYLDKHKLLNENEEPEIPVVRRLSITDRDDYAQVKANEISNHLGFGNIGNRLGKGGNGFAYMLSNGEVLKLTADTGEVDGALKLINKTPNHLAIPRIVYRIIDTKTKESFFAIIMEFIPDKPKELFNQYRSKLNLINPFGYEFGSIFIDFFKNRKSFDYDATIKVLNGILTENKEVGVSDKERKEIYDFMLGLVEIKRELIFYQIRSLDFTVFDNLGYKNDKLVYFDYGGYNEPTIDVNKSNYIFLENFVISEDDEPQDILHNIAETIRVKLKADKLEKIGDGNGGAAYDIGRNFVLKITTDNSEAYANRQLLNKNPKYLTKPFKVIDIKIKNQNITYYAIIMEKVETNLSEFRRLMDRLKFVFKNVFNVGLVDVFEHYVYGNEMNNPIDKDRLLNYMLKNKEDGWFFQSLLRIGKELVEYNISSIDFLNPRNLGFKNGNTVVFFDIGMGDYVGENIIEDGTSLFSTDSSYGRADYPAYNNNNLPPDIENNLDANSEIAERKIGWIDGSKTVEVKKQCKLGGLGNTSKQCNQGDIDNLIIKNVK